MCKCWIPLAKTWSWLKHGCEPCYVRAGGPSRRRESLSVLPAHESRWGFEPVLSKRPALYTAAERNGIERAEDVGPTVRALPGPPNFQLLTALAQCFVRLSCGQGKFRASAPWHWPLQLLPPLSLAQSPSLRRDAGQHRLGNDVQVYGHLNRAMT